MRPLKLVMSAFGPYKEKVEIDFTQFANSSLFLVSGPTGAGKTTIFDAIAYALFDAASGDTRQKETFKSQFAKDTDLCFVELTFELGKKQYFIHREPTQIGPGTRTKTKQIQSNVAFHKGDQVTTKVKEANEEIQQLIGLTYEQFRQIVMLPQGAFKKMLESDSGDKEKVFRNIFKTETFEKFQDVLKEEARVLSKKRESYLQALEQSFNGIVTEGSEELEQAIAHLDVVKVLKELTSLLKIEEEALKETREEYRALQEQRQREEKILEFFQKKETIEEDKRELDERAKKVHTYEQQLDYHAQASKLQEVNKQVKEIKDDKEEKEKQLQEQRISEENLAVKIKESEEMLQNAQEQMDQLDSLRTEIQQLKEEQKQLTLVMTKKQQVTQLEKEKKQKQETKELNEGKRKKLTQSITETSQELEGLQKFKETIQKNYQMLSEKRDTHHQITHRLDKLKQVCELRKQGEKIKNKFSNVRKTYEEAQKNFEQAKISYYSQLAVVLAGELENGGACPVCGSTHHPHKAEAHESAITEEEVARLEKEKVSIEGEYNHLGAQLDYLSKEVIKRCKELECEHTEVDQAYQKVQKEEAKQKDSIQNLEKEIGVLEKRTQQEAQLKKRLEDLQTQERAISEEMSQLHSSIQHMEERKEEVLKEIIEIEEQVTHSSKEEVEHTLSTKEGKVKEIEAHYIAVQKQASEQKTQMASVSKAIQLIQEQISQLEERLETREKQFEELLNQSVLDESYAKHLLDDLKKQRMEEEVRNYKEAVAVHASQEKEVQSFFQELSDERSKEEHQKILQEIISKVPLVEERRDDFIRIVNQNQQAYETIQKYQNESTKIEEDYQMYGELARLANGTKETDYISFERYVLSIYFEEILLAANQRFAHMTNQRYELQRKREKAKGAGPQGLDIDVFDHYTGQVRSVHTLSGGETFKASLALALGLSDVIQNQQGGVSVDTLFIDEGFGTLDADSLDMAIQTLLDLHKKGRLVGIISHVDELKTRIPAHIVVEKTSTGSHATVQV